jgi:hypothetical protein
MDLKDRFVQRDKVTYEHLTQSGCKKKCREERSTNETAVV